jgi:hypothetical protein
MNLVLYIESIYKLARREPNELDGKEGSSRCRSGLVGLGSLLHHLTDVQVDPKSWSGS